MNQQAVHPRIWIFFAVLVVVTFLIGRSSAQSDPKDIDKAVSRIEALSKKSAKRDAECVGFFESLKDKTRDSETKEYFASRASALAALSKAARYPGTPLATSQVIELFLELYEYPTGENLGVLKTSLARLSDCRSIEYYGVLTRLIDPRTMKFFSPAQIDFERRLVLSYLNQEASSGPKFFHQVDKLIDLFAAASDHGLISPAAETRVVIAGLKARKAKVNVEWTDDPGENLEDLAARINMGEELQEELRVAVESELESLEYPSIGIQAMNGKGL